MVGKANRSASHGMTIAAEIDGGERCLRKVVRDLVS
jgi:hypothetical protein